MFLISKSVLEKFPLHEIPHIHMASKNKTTAIFGFAFQPEKIYTSSCLHM